MELPKMPEISAGKSTKLFWDRFRTCRFTSDDKDLGILCRLFEVRFISFKDGGNKIQEESNWFPAADKIFSFSNVSNGCKDFSSLLSHLKTFKVPKLDIEIDNSFRELLDTSKMRKFVNSKTSDGTSFNLCCCRLIFAFSFRKMIQSVKKTKMIDWWITLKHQFFQHLPTSAWLQTCRFYFLALKFVCFP